MDSILAAMLERVPDSYDKSEGSIFYDGLAPVAPEIKALIELANAILDKRLLDTATGGDLDRAAGEFGVERKAAQYAEGEVTFYGYVGTIISAGALVASENVQYYTKYDCTIGTDGTATVEIVCEAPGDVGNVASDCITRMPRVLSGVDRVTNIKPTSGGYAEESDDELRERTYIKIRTPGAAGNIYNYINWALSVEGVGGAKVAPLWNGNGTVKVIIVDSNGEVAPDEVVERTAAYIETVRPVGADVTVVSAIAKYIDITVSVVISTGFDRSKVDEEIKESLKRFLKTFGLSGVAVSYAKIGAAILSVEGVDDYSNLAVNGGDDNIEIASDEVPMMGEFTDAA